VTRVLLLAWACGLLASSALATEPGPPLLFGGAITPRKAPVLLDPRLPRGELRGLPLAPLGAAQLCSLRRPVCVDAAFGRSGLDVLERAYEEHRYGLSLPGPRGDEQEPLVFSWAERPVAVIARDVPGRGYDRAAARCLGAELNVSAARRCVAEAAVIAHSPTTASWLRAGLAAHLAVELGDAAEVQAGLRAAGEHPQLGVLTSTGAVHDWQSGEVQVAPLFRSARFFKYLSERSAAGPGHAGFLALTLGPSSTAAGESRYEAEPDIMDVLSATLGHESGALARFFDDYARYSFVDIKKGWDAGPDTAPGLEEWIVEGATLPRSLALPRPIEPSGSTFVKLKLTAEQRKQTIAVQTRCEAPVSYVWSVMRFSGQQQLTTLPIGYLERGTDYEARVEAMEGVTELVIVGTNLGGVDLAHPFDPDHGPHESHACQVYLSVL